MKYLLIFFFIFSILQGNDDLDLDNGREIYEQTCISCHGVNGDSNTNMNLVVKPRQLRKTILNQHQIYKVIKDGAREYGSKSDIMPSFKYVYSDEELQNVAYYVFTAFAKEQNSYYKKLEKEANLVTNLSLKKGKKFFTKKCSLCHGIKGDGESQYVELSRGDINFIYPYNLQKIILDENQIFLYSKFGGKHWGSHTNDMPSWKKYDDMTLKSISRYIKENIINLK